MPVMFNSLLVAAGLPLPEVRLLRHKDRRAEKGRSPCELWRDNRPLFDQYQSTQTVENESRLRGNYWASFVGTPDGATVFAEMYRVVGKRVMEQDTAMP